jgi:hypothetical protein
MGVPKTGAQVARDFIYLRGLLWLDACLGFELKLAQSRAENMGLLTDSLAKSPCLGAGVRSVLRLCFIYPGIHLTTEQKSPKYLAQVIRKEPF